MPFGIDANGNPTPSNDNNRGGPTLVKGQCGPGQYWTADGGCQTIQNTAQTQGQQGGNPNPQGNQQPKGAGGSCPGGQMPNPNGDGTCVPGAPQSNPGNCPQGQVWNGYNCIPGTSPSTPTPPTSPTKDPFARDPSWSLEQAVAAANNLAYGYNKHSDVQYWAALWAKDPDYAWSRMLGQGAGGADCAKMGPYAGSCGPGTGGGNRTAPVDFTSPLQRFLNINPQQNGPIPQAYQPQAYTGPGNLPTYTPAQFAPIPNYNPSNLRPTTENLIQQMLTTTSFSPEVVARMKESSKDTQLGMAEQLKQQFQQNAASRGAYGSLPTNLANVDMATLSNLSGAYRGIETQKALQDRTDQLAAIQTSDAYQQQLLDEFLQTQSLKLTGEQAQAGEKYKGYQSQQTAFEDQQQQEALKVQASQNAIARWLQAQGIDLSLLGLGENARQFDANNQLNVSRFLAGSI
jgi:hypothetical protein